MQKRTYESRSCFTTAVTNTLGLIVSRLPLGICNTKLIALGTATTILDPRSTLRLSHSAEAFLRDESPPSVKRGGSEASEINVASCPVVVKIRKPDAMVIDVALDASS